MWGVHFPPAKERLTIPDLASRRTPQPVGESISLPVEGVASSLLVGVIWADMEAACCAGAGVGWIALSDGDAGGVPDATVCGSDAGSVTCKTKGLFRQVFWHAGWTASKTLHGPPTVTV